MFHLKLNQIFFGFLIPGSATNKVGDQNAESPANKNTILQDAGSTDVSRAALYDLPQNPPGSPSRKRRFDINCDKCEFCGGSVDGQASAARPSSRSANRQHPGGGLLRANDDSFLYDVCPSRNGGMERRSGGESQPFTVSRSVYYESMTMFNLSNFIWYIQY